MEQTCQFQFLLVFFVDNEYQLGLKLLGVFVVGDGVALCLDFAGEVLEEDFVAVLQLSQVVLQPSNDKSGSLIQVNEVLDLQLRKVFSLDLLLKVSVVFGEEVFF